MRYSPSGHAGSSGWSAAAPPRRSSVTRRPAVAAASCAGPSTRMNKQLAAQHSLSALLPTTVKSKVAQRCELAPTRIDLEYQSATSWSTPMQHAHGSMETHVQSAFDPHFYSPLTEFKGRSWQHLHQAQQQAALRHGA